MIKIKICGARDINFAKAAADAGADYLGLNFVPSSRRFVELAQAKIIINAINKYPIRCVGVFMNQSAPEIERICRYVGLEYVQLYGEAPASLSSSLNKMYVISVNENGLLLKDIEKLKLHCRPDRDSIVLDHPNPGSGRLYPIESLKEQTKGIPFYLAGGITTQNVQQRLTKTGAIGVDVASAVDSIDRCREFISTVRKYQHAN